jgi:hypothetical protein
VNQFLRDGKVDVDSFLRELSRLNPTVGQRLGSRKSTPSGRRSRTA